MEKNMKQGNGNKSFDDLKAVARERASRKFDVIQNVQECEFYDVAGRPQHMQMTLPDSSRLDAVIDDHALDLICGYTHMPASYHRYCNKENKSRLATHNLNEWFRDPETNKQRRMFRFWKPEADLAELPYRLRSFHSSQYMRVR
jgi:hypothetical protein